MTLRPLAIVSVLLLAAAALAGCAANNAGESDELVVGTEAAYPPFEDLVDGEIIGFDIDVMNEVAKRADLKVRYQNAAFDDIIPSVASGQFDVGASAFTINDERKQQVDFTVSYYDNELMVATKADDVALVNEAALVAGVVKVCTQAGTTSETYLREKGYDNDTMVLLPSFPLCGESVLRGDADAMMIDRAAVRDLVAKSDGKLKEGFTIAVNEQFGFAVQKGNGALLTKLNTAINGMKSDGTLQQLMDKWNV